MAESMPSSQEAHRPNGLHAGSQNGGPALRTEDPPNPDDQATVRRIASHGADCREAYSAHCRKSIDSAISALQYDLALGRGGTDPGQRSSESDSVDLGSQENDGDSLAGPLRTFEKKKPCLQQAFGPGSLGTFKRKKGEVKEVKESRWPKPLAVPLDAMNFLGASSNSFKGVRPSARSRASWREQQFHGVPDPDGTGRTSKTQSSWVCSLL